MTHATFNSYQNSKQPVYNTRDYPPGFTRVKFNDADRLKLSEGETNPEGLSLN